jgi:hypothetical protein
MTRIIERDRDHCVHYVGSNFATRNSVCTAGVAIAIESHHNNLKSEGYLRVHSKPPCTPRN